MKKKIFIFVFLGTFLLISSPIFSSKLYVKYYVSYDMYYPKPYPKNDEISLRIRGINKHLAGIVSDTITDMLWNPARLPSVSFVSFTVPNRMVASLPGPLETRLGIFLKGSYSISESKYSDTMPPDYGLNYYYTDYLRSESRCSAGKTYKGALIGAKQVAAETFIGFRLDYCLVPQKSSGDRVYRYTMERKYVSSVDLRNRDDFGKHNLADTTSTYSFSIGLLSSIFDSDMEIILRFRDQKKVGHFFVSNKGLRNDEYIRTYDSTMSISIRNQGFEELVNEYYFESPKIWNLGLRLSRDITEALTFRTIAAFYTGCGDAQMNREDLYYFYRDDYFSHSDPDTFYSYGDTAESYEKGISALDGKTSTLGGFFAPGIEFNISPQLSGGAGIKISYDKNIVELEGTKDEVYDTLTSHFMVNEKDIASNVFIYVPFGIEYKPIQELALRAGFSLYGSYRFTEYDMNGYYYMSKYTSGPHYNLSFGVGYNWKRFKFDIYTMDIAAVRLWEIELGYIF